MGACRLLENGCHSSKKSSTTRVLLLSFGRGLKIDMRPESGSIVTYVALNKVCLSDFKETGVNLFTWMQRSEFEEEGVCRDSRTSVNTGERIWVSLFPCNIVLCKQRLV